MYVILHHDFESIWKLLLADREDDVSYRGSGIDQSNIGIVKDENVDLWILIVQKMYYHLQQYFQ